MRYFPVLILRQSNKNDRKARNSTILIELKKQLKKLHMFEFLTEFASASASLFTLGHRVVVGRVRVAYDDGLDAVLLFRIFRNQH
jgi:hypothetical protein